MVALVNHTHAHGHYQPWLAMLNDDHPPWLTMMMLTMVDHVKPWPLPWLPMTEHRLFSFKLTMVNLVMSTIVITIVKSTMFNHTWPYWAFWPTMSMVNKFDLVGHCRCTHHTILWLTSSWLTMVDGHGWVWPTMVDNDHGHGYGWLGQPWFTWLWSWVWSTKLTMVFYSQPWVNDG